MNNIKKFFLFGFLVWFIENLSVITDQPLAVQLSVHRRPLPHVVVEVLCRNKVVFYIPISELEKERSGKPAKGFIKDPRWPEEVQDLLKAQARAGYSEALRSGLVPMPPVTNQMRPVDSTSDQLYVVFQGNDEASLKKAVSLLKEKYKIQRAESNVAHFLLPKNGNEANLLKEHGQLVAQEDEDVYVFKVNQTKNEKQKPFLQLSFFAWFQALLKNAFYGQWHHSASFHNERKYKPGAKFQSNVSVKDDIVKLPEE